MASMSLRALESRGLLSARRVRRQVQYRIATEATGTVASELAKALKNLKNDEAKPLAIIFRAATGFTHPARVEIYRRLVATPMNETQLAAVVHLSHFAVLRHLRKLETRGYIVRRNDRYEAVMHPDAVGRILAELALQGGNITL